LGHPARLDFEVALFISRSKFHLPALPPLHKQSILAKSLLYKNVPINLTNVYDIADGKCKFDRSFDA
jgi:hypothetical protein